MLLALLVNFSRMKRVIYFLLWRVYNAAASKRVGLGGR